MFSTTGKRLLSLCNEFSLIIIKSSNSKPYQPIIKSD